MYIPAFGRNYLISSNNNYTVEFMLCVCVYVCVIEENDKKIIKISKSIQHHLMFN